MSLDPASENKTEVEIIERANGFDGVFRVGVFKLRHRTFAGDMSPVLTREVFERGNAAAVLPYDPESDTVLLIRQFLVGAHIAGRPNRPYQAIAGIVEAGETGQDVAVREAIEEAGCEIRRIERAHAFLPSPGGSSEYIETFVAEADLSAAGGQFGLEEEHEDIRAEVLPALDAIARLDDGSIEAGPAVVLLAYFARHRERIRSEWRGGAP
ncbi:NUDIX domain-containing protein [Rubellimicrobium arenae]|uniref:NUDIX domain-containing protein n=1 Tax=Rubellimicrobium arenae TaxID=2817372 RepID=UPI001B316649|nr:NUDIX domain-containing protein [Rubellimicrobium arenae]